MKFTKLNIDWNADLGAPEEKIFIIDDTVVVEFFLNCSIYKRFSENDRGKLTFTKCHKYFTGGTNDEGYFMGQHRYNDDDLPWGQFYKLETDWNTEFAADAVLLGEVDANTELNHYLFFFKDSTFECVAASFKVEFILSNI
ncbi:hypothetical protein [Mucilaginibacter sp.]|uniref:hypothetical protein n=1 Tax=Mucilaginibacter sp. TaxID=1882438 RepID=UPI0035BC6866